MRWPVSSWPKTSWTTQQVTILTRKKTKKAKTAIYARFSSEMQATDSADTQIARARRKAAAGELNCRLFPDHGFEIQEHWVMKDEAASGKNAGRDGYQLILQGIRDQRFEVLLVDDFSRLTRDMGDLLDLYDLARWHDVEVISVCEGISSADDQSKQFFMLKGLVNQLGNDAHAQRTLSRMEEHFINGFSTGSIPYGYTTIATQKQIRKGREYECRARIIIHEGRARVVRRIFQMAVDGLGRNEIANMLNKELLPCPSRTHRKDGEIGAWNASTIKTILYNERYVGIWTWRNNVRGKNPITKSRAQKRNDPSKVVRMKPEIAETLRIIPQEIWNTLAERREITQTAIREANNRGELIFGDRLGKNGADHLLSGLLRCSECGANLVLASGKRGGYYGCNDVYRGTGRCKNKALIKRSRVEESLLKTIHTVLSKDEWVRKLAKRINHWRAETQTDTPKTRKVIEKELASLDREVSNLVDFVVKGNHSETICAALAARERRKGALQAELRKLAVIESQHARTTQTQSHEVSLRAEGESQIGQCRDGKALSERHQDDPTYRPIESGNMDRQRHPGRWPDTVLSCLWSQSRRCFRKPYHSRTRDPR